MKNSWLAALVALPVVAAFSVDCAYLKDPEGFRYDAKKHWPELSAWTERVALGKNGTPSRYQSVTAGEITRKNFIDDFIFGRMERDGIQPAPPADDPEFLRRVYLDLTGRIPSVEQLRSFIEDSNPAKRDALVDSLIGTEEFVDKWTMFLGDLFKNDGPSSNVNRYLQGRDVLLQIPAGSCFTEQTLFTDCAGTHWCNRRPFSVWPSQLGGRRNRPNGSHSGYIRRPGCKPCADVPGN
jgi:hypothetical protein